MIQNIALCKAFRGYVKAVFVVLTAALVLMTPLPASSAALPDNVSSHANLRGYGPVQASFGPESATFSCADTAHADILLGKLLADMFWDAGSERTSDSITLQGRTVPVYGWQPHGFVALARIGHAVVVRGAPTVAGLAKILHGDPRFGSASAVYKPARDYPRYLDFYDLRALKSYTGAMTGAADTGLDSHWPFMKKFGIAGVVDADIGFQFQNPAPDVIDWTPSDYEFREAERQGGIAVPAFVVGGPMPMWDYNDHPDLRMEPSPTTLLGSWGKVGTAGGSFESWGTPIEQRERTNFAFMRQVMQKYGNSPAIGGWMPWGGSPGAELNFHGRTDEFWDYSLAGEQSFRSWLRFVKGYSLSDMSRRWYGNPTRLRSWSDVHLPDVQSFFGNLDSSSMRVADGWEWQAAPDTVAIAPPSPGDPAWTPLAMPPSQQEAYLPWGPSFYRVSFDPSKWADSNKGVDHYLVLALEVQADDGTQVWLNGAYLGEFKSKAGMYGPIGLKVTALLRHGPNELALRVPGTPSSEGKILGPVFLTTTLPRYYPYLGAERNAQYVDVHEWQAYGMVAQNDQMFREMRAIDPNRPMVLSGGAIEQLGDYTAELASKYDLGVEMTGREAFYYPWNSGLGLVAGFYSTSEASNTAQGTSLDRMFGWMMFDGDASHALVYRLDNYIEREKQDGWFTKHAALLRLFGKALRVNPRIVLFRSVETSRLGDDTPSNWDIGRGEIQAAHYDNAYATEREVAKGLVNGYPVMLDCGSTIMDPATVAAIRRYVESGGTFIAIHNTGRHTTIEPDSWPISALTGFKVLSSDVGGPVKFDANLPIMQGLAGKTFSGDGTAVNWLGNESGKGVGLRLQPDVPEAKALARWSDGSIAVGYRPLGKGRVIVLGSAFWRDGKDQSGVWRSQTDVEQGVFEQLFGTLGVSRTASASTNAVWTREFVTKNGLENWVIAFNTIGSDMTADISYRLSSRPAQVWDIATRRSVPFTYADGWVHIPNTAIGGLQVRVFGSSRASLADGLAVWWGEKLKYWNIPQGSQPVPVPALKQAGETIPFDHWKFMPDRDNQIDTSGAWRIPGFADSSWATTGVGAWNDLYPALGDYHGAGLYRACFTIPAPWSGRRILLNLYSFDRAIAYDKASIWINGKQAAVYTKRLWSQTFNYDITPSILPGENVIAIRVDGGQEFSGLCGCVWISPQSRLSPTIDLAGEWSNIGADFKPLPPVTVPGKATGRYLERSFVIPQAWQGKSVFLRFRSADLWVGSIVVNGRSITYNSYMHPYGTISDVNISPYMHAGSANTLEIWPHWTASEPVSGHPTTNMQLDEVSVGCFAH